MNKFLKFPLFIMAVAVICTTIVVGVHSVTQPILEEKAKEVVRSTIDTMYPDAKDFEISKKKLESKYLEALYIVEDKDGKKYNVYQTSAMGKVDFVKMLVSVNEDNVINNLLYTQMKETKGIGTKLAEPEYIKTILGQSLSDLKVDGVTGATYTSEAVKISLEAIASDLGGN